MDANLRIILDLTRYLTEMNSTFYLNIRTANGLKFEMETKTGNPEKFGTVKNREERGKRWKMPAQIARDRARLHTFCKHNSQKNYEVKKEEAAAAADIEPVKPTKKLEKLVSTEKPGRVKAPMEKMETKDKEKKENAEELE